MQRMKLSEYVASTRGRVGALATAVGVSGSLVTQWAAGKSVSAERCVEIERATDRAVMRWDLRPADWHLVWPELVGAEGAPAISPTQQAA